MTHEEFETGLVEILAASYEMVHDILEPKHDMIADRLELKQAVIALFQILPKQPERIKRFLDDNERIISSSA